MLESKAAGSRQLQGVLDEQFAQRVTSQTATFAIKKKNGSVQMFDYDKVYNCFKRVSHGFEDYINFDLLMQEVTRNVYDQISSYEIEDALILAAITFIERDPLYSTVGARLLLQKLAKEVFGHSVNSKNYEQEYRNSFIRGIQLGVEDGVIDPRLQEFDLHLLASHLELERDDLFGYLGLRTLYERYFFKAHGRRIEVPQVFWMRIAMGVALNETGNRNERAIEFYNTISQMLFVPSTPTLLHAGGTHPQLSSCYLTTISDDLGHIFKCLGDNAQMSRWSGGVANDWTPLRATGSYIRSIKSGSQGVVPFLKIANDVTAAINRSGSRRGATVAYLEVWHYDFEDFLDLRRNTGDERRRTHDMNTAAWVPDLFMKRVEANESWTFFSPHEVPELHELYGKAFEQKYVEYEQAAQNGQIKLYRTIAASELWRKMLTRLFETGHPWITFKDPCNIRSPQDHVGVVHSSNLCTEITLNTSAQETAVCNLGSINLSKHIVDNDINQPLFAHTIKTAIRMLDNVIDINFYPTIEGANSNKKHRPIGLGMMGLQDALFQMDVSFSSPAAIDFSDRIGEMFSYYAILSSSQLAQERGVYESYKGSKWDRNIFPVDTLDLLEAERGQKIDMNRIERLDWQPVREHVKKHGMRNSNTMAIAPTATIANIAGCFPCIEPIYKNLYVKANMGGEFTVVNTYLVNDLKKLGVWNHDTLDLLKYYDGNISRMDFVPDHLKQKYQEAFDIEPEILIDMTAVRAKWIDQSQSHNVFLRGVSGKKLDSLYRYGWHRGIKTFYYLRTLGASQIEKSTLDAKKFGFTQTREYELNKVDEAVVPVKSAESCSITNPECEACQ